MASPGLPGVVPCSPRPRQQSKDFNNPQAAGVGRKTRDDTKVTWTRGTSCDEIMRVDVAKEGTGKEGTGRNWVSIVARMLELREEDICIPEGCGLFVNATWRSAVANHTSVPRVSRSGD